MPTPSPRRTPSPKWTAHADDHGGEPAFWVAQQDRFDRMLAPFGDRMLAAARIQAGERVLDLGCGTGWTTVEAVERAGPSGAAHGVDISSLMVEAAQRRARSSGVSNVTFETADVGTLDQPSSFDVAISRFAIGHVDDLTHVLGVTRKALTDHGRLAVIEWGAESANPWMALAHPDRGHRSRGTGRHQPALASQESLHDTVQAAGYRDVHVESVGGHLWMGHSLDDVVRAWQASPDAQPAAREDPGAAETIRRLRDRLGEHVTSRGVELPGAAWLVTASA